MKTITDIKTMKDADNYCCQHECSAKELIYRAGKKIAEYQTYEDRILIVCGSGNNGADGFVIAMVLKQKHYDVSLLLLNEKISPDGLDYYKECQNMNIPVFLYEENFDFSVYKTIFDCIFGIGYQDKADKRIDILFNKINNSKAYVVSVDINSGLNGNNGLCASCIDSDLTIAINNYKYGHFLNMAKDHIKKLACVDIGIDISKSDSFLLEKNDLKEILGYRLNYSHKGTYAYTALIGGCLQYSGAIRLANMANAALRSGSGVVKVAVPKTLAPLLVPQILEATLFPLSDNDYQIVFKKEEIDELMKGTKVICLGMGIGNSTEIKKLLCYLLENYQGTLIIDADGLNVLSSIDKEIIKKHRQPLILTPHLKECSRLLDCDINIISNNPAEAAVKLAKEYQSIVLLKGPCTIVSDSKKTYFSNTGCPGMATAGSGDVLSGIVCALCGYNGNNLLLATASAAYLNGLAGELAQKKNNAISMLASDTASCISEAVSSIFEMS